ncbi:MAG: hypothetical protein V4598_12980 [Bdellovibrionota bacterium]
MLNQKLKFSLPTLILTILATIIWSEFTMSRQNVLALKKDWHLAQEGFINPGLHVIPNLVFRKNLTGYRLSTDNLMGMMRILSNETLEPEESKLWFRIGSDSYLDMIFNADEAGFTGIRLSSSDLFPSGIYRSDDNGKFSSFTPLNLRLDSGFKSVVVKNGKLTIGKETLSLPDGLISQGQAGIQLSTMEAEVFAYEVKSKKSRMVLHFFPEGTRWELYGKYFVLIAILVLLSGFLPRSRKEITAAGILGIGLLALLSGIVIEPQEDSIDEALAINPSLTNKIEELRRNKYFPGIFHCVSSGCRMLAENEMPAKKTGKRIVIFGGSQIKPSVVRKLEDSFFYKFDQYLREKNPGFELLNINSTGQFKDRLKFEKQMAGMEIDEIIIETLAFSHELDLIKEFIGRWNKKGVRIIMLRTPQNIENFGEKLTPVFIPKIREGLKTDIPTEWDPQLAHVLRNVPLIRKMQDEVSFEFLDPNDVFLTESTLTSGQLYWDGYHLTAWGQEILAKWLAESYKIKD